MSHFHASLTGSGKSTATKTGTKTSGISGHIRGWNAGVKIIGMSRSDDTDTFQIFITSGSNGGASDRLIGFVDNDGDYIPFDDDVHDYKRRS